ncbi:MAG: efflux transporter periplasmic adaptor subunit [Gemmatimonadetes bacterium]|nr:efflux transporter periplasmic adaptor subunit [Gemmatimonadota bacterium]
MSRRAFATPALLAVTLVFGIACSRADEGEVATDVGVHVGRIERATLHGYVTAYGYVEPAPAEDGTPAAGAVLSPLSPGVLAEIHAVEGRRVAKGDVLFRLDSRMAEVLVRKAEDDVTFAEQTLTRQQLLLQTDGTSQRALQDAQQRLSEARNALAAARTGLAYLEIVAPLAGTVVQLNARAGQSVDATTVLAKIVDLNRLVVTAGVPAGEAEGLKVGLRVLLGADSAAAHGTLTIVGREVDTSTGTYRVQASIPAGAGFTPGQFTEIRIIAQERKDVLVIPEAALVTRAGEGTWIAVVDGDQAVRRAVTVGLRDGGRVEVSGEGLEAGTRIVTDEAYGLPASTRIHVLER